jgi:hypothetical protein
MIYRVLMAQVTRAGMAAIIGWLTLSTAANAQAPLLSARQALAQIMEQTLPACQDALHSVAAKKEDAMFLTRKLREAGWGNVSKEYVLSLNDLADGLREAAKGPPHQASCDKIRLIVSDLHVKRKDCEKLGHSRTDIPVEVSTSRGRNVITGLEVYVRWIPAGDHFDTEPKRLRDFSSPARGTVPIPGEFEVFAKDPSTGNSTEPERLSIGGAEVFRWALQVRFPDNAQSSK